MTIYARSRHCNSQFIANLKGRFATHFHCLSPRTIRDLIVTSMYSKWIKISIHPFATKIAMMTIIYIMQDSALVAHTRLTRRRSGGSLCDRHERT